MPGRTVDVPAPHRQKRPPSYPSGGDSGFVACLLPVGKRCGHAAQRKLSSRTHLSLHFQMEEIRSGLVYHTYNELSWKTAPQGMRGQEGRFPPGEEKRLVGDGLDSCLIGQFYLTMSFLTILSRRKKYKFYLA